jgi:hypothetical protein
LHKSVSQQNTRLDGVHVAPQEYVLVVTPNAEKVVFSQNSQFVAVVEIFRFSTLVVAPS